MRRPTPPRRCHDEALLRSPNPPVRPRWLLEEIGAPYELVRLDFSKSDHKKPDYLKIHPHGAVPAPAYQRARAD